MGTAIGTGHRTITLHRKGGRVALAPLAARTADAIDRMLGDREEGPLFVTRTGKRLDRQSAWKTVRKLALTAGIAKPTSPHSLRRGFVTVALDAGVPLHRVQDVAATRQPNHDATLQPVTACA
jgi:integrase/recombinase XerD